MLIDGFLPKDASKDSYDILMISVTNLYSKLDTDEKLLVALTFDAGYTQTVVAMILQVSSKTISSRIKKLKKKLELDYGKNHFK